MRKRIWRDARPKIGELQGHKLTEREIDKLYEKEPDLHDPYYPRELLKINERDVYIFYIEILDTPYICISSPWPEEGDEWFNLKNLKKIPKKYL